MPLLQLLTTEWCRMNTYIFYLFFILTKSVVHHRGLFLSAPSLDQSSGSTRTYPASKFTEPKHRKWQLLQLDSCFWNRAPSDTHICTSWPSDDHHLFTYNTFNAQGHDDTLPEFEPPTFWSWDNVFYHLSYGLHDVSNTSPHNARF